MQRTKKRSNRLTLILSLLLAAILVIAGGVGGAVQSRRQSHPKLSAGPSYQQVQSETRGKTDQSASYAIHNNQPYFGRMTYTRTYKHFSELDALGRCGPADAVLGPETMPSEPRGFIGSVKPSGWHTVRYDDLIPDGKYLYNRCHLIGYQLSGENANPQNLITGTRYLNVQGMEPWENQVASYMRQSNNHVHYRVTPCFQGSELVARGVVMEAESLEDHGRGLKFCIYCPNIQPGVTINYQDGSSWRADTVSPRSVESRRAVA